MQQYGFHQASHNLSAIFFLMNSTQLLVLVDAEGDSPLAAYYQICPAFMGTSIWKETPYWGMPGPPHGNRIGPIFLWGWMLTLSQLKV